MQAVPGTLKAKKHRASFDAWLEGRGREEGRRERRKRGKREGKMERKKGRTEGGKEGGRKEKEKAGRSSRIFQEWPMVTPARPQKDYRLSISALSVGGIPPERAVLGLPDLSLPRLLKMENLLC